MVIYGRRLYGRRLEHRGSYVATWFFHLWFVPLIPLGSVMVLRELDGSSFETHRIDFNWRSAGLALLRVSPVLMVFHALDGFGDLRPGDPSWPMLLELLCAAALFVVALFVVGRPSADDRARLDAYALVYGYAVDLALLPEAAAIPLADRLRQVLVERGRAVALNYRANYDPATQWGALALDPSMRDPDVVLFAQCLARTLSGRAHGAERAQLDALHDQLHAKRLALTPAPTHAAPAQPTV